MKAKVLAVSHQKKAIKVSGENGETFWLSFNGKTSVPTVEKGSLVDVEFISKNGKNWVNSIKVLNEKDEEKSVNGLGKERSVVALSLIKTAVEMGCKTTEEVKDVTTRLIEIYKSLVSSI